MKQVANIILFYLFVFISSETLDSTIVEIKEKNKELIEKLYECLNKLTSDSFRRIINENKGKKFGDIIKDHRVALTRQDKEAIKECRKKILLDSKDNKKDLRINNKVNLKRIKAYKKK